MVKMKRKITTTKKKNQLKNEDPIEKKIENLEGLKLKKYIYLDWRVKLKEITIKGPSKKFKNKKK